MIELLWSYRGYFQAAIVALLFLLALARGGAPEKWCACILLAAIIAARLHEIVTVGVAGTWSVGGFATDELAYLLIDFLTFAALGAVALQANRMYPLWMAGVQLTALLTHIAERTTDVIAPLAYAILNLSTFYLAILLLAGGLAAHMRRSRSGGTYPSWRSDLPRSQAMLPLR